MKRANEAPASPGHAPALINTEFTLRHSQQPTPSTALTTPSITATASTGTNPGSRPGMTSVTDRTGTALLPAAPLPFHSQAGYPAHSHQQLQPRPHAVANSAYRPPAIDLVPGVQHNQQHLPPPNGWFPVQPAAPSPVAQPAATPAKPVGEHGDRDIFKDTNLDSEVKSKISGHPNVWKVDFLTSRRQQRTDFLIVSFFQIAMMHGSSGDWNAATDMIMDMVGIDAMLAQKWPASNSLAHILARIKNHKWLALALARDGALQSLHAINAQGFSPLHVAVINGKKKMVQAILAHDDEAGSLRLKKFKDNHIPLHLACQANHISTVELLLGSKGKEQRLSSSALGSLPLHLALVFGTGVLPYLLAECAIEQVTAQTGCGQNALMLAAEVGSPNTVKMLLDIPGTLAVQLGARDSKGKGVIEYVRAGGKANVIALIDAAMRSLAAASSSSAPSAAVTVAAVSGAHQGPVPMTPYPTSPTAGENFGFSDTEIESDEQ